MARRLIAGGTLLCFCGIASLSGCGAPRPESVDRSTATTGNGNSPGAEHRTEISDPAYPMFTLSDLDGRPISLADFRGKVVFIQFWATWCHSCTEEIRNLDLLYQRYRDQGFVIVSVAVDDSAEKLRAFRDEFGIELPILNDSEGHVKNLFHLMGLPVAQALDRNGRITSIEDPKTRTFTERISGSREWTTPEGVASIERLLKQNPRR